MEGGREADRERERERERGEGGREGGGILVRHHTLYNLGRGV